MSDFRPETFSRCAAARPAGPAPMMIASGVSTPAPRNAPNSYRAVLVKCTSGRLARSNSERRCGRRLLRMVSGSRDRKRIRGTFPRLSSLRQAKVQIRTPAISSGSIKIPCSPDTALSGAWKYDLSKSVCAPRHQRARHSRPRNALYAARFGDFNEFRQVIQS